MSHIATTAWVDGILIQPQHFEQQERAFKDYVFRSLGYLADNAWGLDTIVVDDDALELNKIVFKAISGRFQDGTVFHVSGADLATLAMSVDQNIADELVYLTLPMNEQISEMPINSKRFYLAEVKLENSLNPSEPESPVVVKKLALGLSLGSQLKAEDCALPILKIKRSDESQGIMLDENYIPPHLNSKNMAMVIRMIDFSLGLLERKQKQLAHSIAAPLQTRTLTSQTDVGLLQLLNRSTVQLTHLSNLERLAPADLYEFYVLLLAELGTFYQKDRLAITLPSYSHQQLSLLFQQARDELSRVLKTRFEHQAISIDLVKQEEMGIYQAYIDSDTLLQNSDLVLAVRGNDVADNHSREEHIKLSDLASMRDIVYLQLAGVELERLNVAPPQIPYFEDALYFRAKPEGKHWQSMLSSKELALYDESQSGDALSLWAIPHARDEQGV